jgi:hypothetical protein
MDFSCIFDLCGAQRFILSVINYHTRELVLTNATASPNRIWIMQQFKNVSVQNYPFAKYLIIDNDGIYGKWIDVLLPEYFGMKICRIPYLSPWFNGAVERFIKTLKTELLFRLPCHSTREIQSVCSQFKDYYNNHRAHQGNNGKIPSKIKRLKPKGPVGYEKVKHMNGLFTSYEMAA